MLTERLSPVGLPCVVSDSILHKALRRVRNVACSSSRGLDTIYPPLKV
jgi:hypothetical protein